MKHPKIESIIEKRFEKINEALDRVRLSFEDDDIRLFRVKVKKLTACLHLIDAVNKHSHQLNVPQKISKPFRLSAAIRTLQLQQTFIAKTCKEHQIPSPETYLKLLAEKVLQHTASFHKHNTTAKSFKKEEAKLVQSLPGNISNKTIDGFFAAETHKLAKLLEPVFPTDSSLHNVRTLLKDWLYLSPYIDTAITELSPYPLLATFEAIDSFTVQLGDFHDLNVAILSLHGDCLKMEIDEHERTALQNIELTWAVYYGDSDHPISGQIDPGFS
jgi:hypothetical protein